MVELRAPGRAQQPRDSRVLVFSQRRLQINRHLTMLYEFEDAIASFDDVLLLSPDRVPYADTGAVARRVLNGSLNRVGVPRRTPPWTRPSMRPTAVTGQHDLFFGVFGDAFELSYLRRLKGWRERSRRAVCFLTEVWSNTVARDADYYDVLRQFDAVYMFTPQAAPALAALGAPSPAFLPVAVDAELFSPVPRPPKRVLDVYTFGRTSPVVHQQLLDLVDSAGLTYLYDTVTQAGVHLHREHRALLANMMKRSLYSPAHRINDSSHRELRTGGEESLSSRYFEIAAGGAVVIGSRPRTPDFDTCFDYPDAVIDLPYDSVDVEETLHELNGQAERLAKARAAGVQASLLRHDWVHRWERILTDGGMSVTPAMQARQARLQELAAQVTPEALA